MKIRCILSGLCLLLFACSKQKSPDVPKSVPVTINGKAYETVVIGSQTWTSVNYDGPGGIANPALNESVYGKYYTIDEATSITLPEGWRIPTKNDFETLLRSQGTVTRQFGIITLDSLKSERLRSTSNWVLPGNNASGFNAQPAGFGYAPTLTFTYVYGTAYFLSSTNEIIDQQFPRNNTYADLSVIGAPALNKPLTLEEGAVIDTGIIRSYHSCTLRFVKDN